LESGLKIQPFYLNNDVCGAVGHQTYLLEEYGLNRTLIYDYLMNT
jgi:hypothetical protein